MATLYKRDRSPFWWASWLVGTTRQRESTGVRHNDRKTPCPLAKGVLGKIEERLVRQKHGLTAMLEPIGVREFYEAYLRGFSKHPQSTQDKYHALTNQFLKWAEANKVRSTADLSAANTTAYVRYRELTLTGKSVRDERNYHKAAALEAKRLGHLAFEINPWDIDVKVEKADKTPFAAAQITAMLALNEPAWLPAAVRFGLYTGARLDSVFNLQWEFISFEFNVINFDRSKTGAYSMPLHPALKAWLETKRQTTGPVFPGLRKAEHDDVRFARYMSKLFIDKMTQSGIGGTFHMFRHTLATRLAEDGVDKRVTMELLNHEDENVHRAYTHVDAQKLLPHLAKVSFA
jgi:integrase